MTFLNKKEGLLAARLFALACILFIVAFQVFWLHADYTAKKQQLLKEAENKLVEQVIFLDNTKMAGSITLRGEDTSFTVDLGQMIRQMTTDGPFRKDPKLRRLKKPKLVDATFLMHLPLNRKDTTNYARTIYKSLINQGDFRKAHGPFIVYYSLGRKIFKYPRDVDIDAGNATEEVNSSANPFASYQIYFEHLPVQVLMQMKGSFLLSLVYIVLSIGTLAILLYNLTRTRKLMEMKSNFTHNMTHELKTPVATLYAATEALDKYNALDDKATARKYIGLMHGDLERLSGMIDSILTNVRLNSGKADLFFESLDLHGLLSELSEELALRLAATNAIISFENMPLSLKIWGDRQHIKTVFVNLIDNSLKYAGKAPQINISAQGSGNRDIILFSDNGPGIPDQYRKDIFEQYFRVPESNLHTVKGYGLGLSYVRSIVLQHKGSIRLKESSESGTIFEIILPASHG